MTITFLYKDVDVSAMSEYDARRLNRLNIESGSKEVFYDLSESSLYSMYDDFIDSITPLCSTHRSQITSQLGSETGLGVTATGVPGTAKSGK